MAGMTNLVGLIARFPDEETACESLEETMCPDGNRHCRRCG